MLALVKLCFLIRYLENQVDKGHSDVCRNLRYLCRLAQTEMALGFYMLIERHGMRELIRQMRFAELRGS